ncbi:MAG: ABC-2 family transporter protein [Hungatella sp.]|nr:ABC-2 family transporter protein [Hungatella sp.]
MNSIRLYEKYLFIHLKSMMQHKVSFLLTTIGQFLISFNIFLGVRFMMDRFKEVKGFSYGEVLLCFSITLMAYTIAEAIFRSLDTFETIIGNGEFDRILLRPRGSLFLVLCSKIELTRIGRLLQAAVMLVYGLNFSSITWNPVWVVTVILMITGGVAVFAAIYLIFASICFFTLEGLEFMNVFTDGAREYGKYPIGIYGKTLLTICTYLVPFALFQYYPFLYLTGKASDPRYSLLPLAACLFLVPAGLLWKFGLSRYQSTGS